MSTFGSLFYKGRSPLIYVMKSAHVRAFMLVPVETRGISPCLPQRASG